MKYHIHIISSVLLVVMLTSIMPKAFLHDLFANHTDITSCNDSKVQGPCIHKQGFNCNQADLVVPTAYTCSDASIKACVEFVREPIIILSSFVLRNFHAAAAGRGPPVQV